MLVSNYQLLVTDLGPPQPLVEVDVRQEVVGLQRVCRGSRAAMLLRVHYRPRNHVHAPSGHHVYIQNNNFKVNCDLTTTITLTVKCESDLRNKGFELFTRCSMCSKYIIRRHLYRVVNSLRRFLDLQAFKVWS